MLISSDFSAITDCRLMQGLFEAADSITPSRRNRYAVVTSQYIDSLFNCVLMLATKSFLVHVLNK